MLMVLLFFSIFFFGVAAREGYATISAGWAGGWRCGVLIGVGGHSGVGKKHDLAVGCFNDAEGN